MAGKAIPINQWHIEMAEFVQSIDIHNRLVSSSATRNYPEKIVDALLKWINDNDPGTYRKS